MRKKERARPSENDPKWLLSNRITDFVNIAFGRKLRASRALYDAVSDAIDAGYTEDEIRIAVWAARCIEGHWLREHLSEDVGPEYILRFKGGENPETGRVAKRWLDDLISRIGEMNMVVSRRVLAQLPKAWQDEESELFARMDLDLDAGNRS